MCKFTHVCKSWISFNHITWSSASSDHLTKLHLTFNSRVRQNAVSAYCFCTMWQCQICSLNQVCNKQATLCWTCSCFCWRHQQLASDLSIASGGASLSKEMSKLFKHTTDLSSECTLSYILPPSLYVPCASVPECVLSRQMKRPCYFLPCACFIMLYNINNKRIAYAAQLHWLIDHFKWRVLSVYSFKRSYGPVDREIATAYRQRLIKCYGLKYKPFNVSSNSLLCWLIMPLWWLQDTSIVCCIMQHSSLCTCTPVVNIVLKGNICVTRLAMLIYNCTICYSSNSIAF